MLLITFTMYQLRAHLIQIRKKAPHWKTKCRSHSCGLRVLLAITLLVFVSVTIAEIAKLVVDTTTEDGSKHHTYIKRTKLIVVLKAVMLVMLFILYSAVMATLRKELKHFDEDTL